MRHAILILLRAYVFDIVAPVMGVAMGLALGSSNNTAGTVIAVSFIILTLGWMATSPKQGDADWRPFEAHLGLAGIAFVAVAAGLTILFLVVGTPDSRCLVTGFAGGFVGLLVASSCSPPAQV